MGNFINLEIIGNPINWLIVIMILLFVSYGMFVIWTNADALTPILPAVPGV